jgi:glutaredoxin 3
MPADSPARIEMFSGPGCAYCARSRELLEGRGIPYVEYDVSDPAHLSDYRRRLPRTTSLPQIFIDGKHIGSYEDLVDIDQRGELGG